MTDIFYWLTIAEYLCVIITLITLVIATVTGKLFMPLLFLTITVLLNLINRLTTNKRNRLRTNTILKKLHNRVENLEGKIDRKEIIVPPPPLNSSDTSPEIIASYQEYLGSIEKSLTNLIQYINHSAIVPRIEYLEQVIKEMRSGKAGAAPSELNNLSINKSAMSEPTSKPLTSLQTIPQESIPPHQNWHCINTFTGHSQSVTALVLNPDGKFLASGGWDKTLKIWSLKDGKLLDSITAHKQALLSLDFTNYNGSESLTYYLATGSFDQTIKLWNLDKNKEKPVLLTNIKTLTNHTGSVHALAIAPQHKILISGSYDQTLKQWDLETGKLLCSSYDPLGAIYAISLHEQRELIASAGGDGSISIWQLGSGEMLSFLGGNVSSIQSLVISPDGETLAAGCVDGKIRIWQLEANIFQSKIEPLPNRIIQAHSGQVTSLVFTPDSQNLFSSGADGKVKIWHLSTCHNLGVLTINENEDNNHNRVLALALSADGELLTVGSVDGKITVWLRVDQSLNIDERTR